MRSPSALSWLLGAVMPLFAVACGGGGGGTAASTLESRVNLEQSPPESLPAWLSPPVAASAVAERRLDDHLHSAIDLGSEDCRHEGRVGDAGDPRDVLRLGPLRNGGTLQVELAADGDCELTALVMPAGLAPRLGLELRPGSSMIELARGEELTLIVTAPRPCAYAIAIGKAPGTPPPAAVPLAATRASELFADVLGGPGLHLVPGEVIVSEADASAAPAELQALGLQLVARGGPLTRWRHANAAAFPSGAAGQQAVADLVRDVRRHSPGLRYVSPNAIAPLSALAGLAQPPVEPNDPLFLSNQFNLILTRFPQAWDITTGADGVSIAVLDSGLLLGHPDLADRVSPWAYDFISNPLSADDGDGIDADASDPPQLGILTIFHGTYVAGVCSAVTGNGIGVAGGTWRGQVMPLRVFGKLGGETWDLLQAVRYAAGLSNASSRVLTPAQRPRVLNMSFTYPAIEALRVEIENAGKAGLLMVAAAGNHGQVNGDPMFPAAWPEVLGVGAVDRQLVRTTYSNAGSFVDVAACGGLGVGKVDGVTSTWGIYKEPELTYGWWSFEGTSLASPAVAAAIALMASVNPELDLATVQSVLAATCLDRGPIGKDEFYGWGVLQADAAVQRAKELGPPRLELVPGGYVFKDAESLKVLSVVNAGGRTLQGLQVVAIGEPSGGVAVSLSAVSAPADIVARVDRARVKVGSYRDAFELRSNAGGKPFELAFRKPIPPPVPATVRIWWGEQIAAEVTTDATGAFRLPGLPNATLRLEIGVDLDRNGRLGDSQEWYSSRTIVLPADLEALREIFVPWKQ